MVFKKGNVPWNTGKKGYRLPKSSATKKAQFASGELVAWHKGKKGVMPTPWNKGSTKITNPKLKRLSEKVSAKMKGNTNKRGKKITTKLKWSSWLIGHGATPGSFKKGQQAWNKNRKASENTRKKLSDFAKNRSKDYKEKLRLAAIRQTQKFPKAYTEIELKLANELSNRGHSFYMQKPIEGITKPDISIPEKKIAIFADGDYWHNTPSSKLKDPIINQKLKEQGWTVLRFWEHDIKKDVKKCVNRIEKALKDRIS